MRGRKPHVDPPIQVNITLPESVLLDVDSAIADPITKKPPYGMRSQLILTLLVRWLNGEIKDVSIQPKATIDLEDLAR